MIGGKQPNAAERHWHNWLREQSCAICGQPTAIHHAIGSTGRHNKIHIGQWWVVPLCYDYHQGQGGIHNDLSAFGAHDKLRLGSTRKEIEKSLFSIYASKYEAITGRKIPAKVKEAIRDYRR